MKANLATTLIGIGAFVYLLLPDPAHPYPISPVPLWELTDAASLIVLGDVIEIEDSMSQDASSSIDPFEAESIGLIAGREVWKGEARAQVEVHFEPNLICPAPARYVMGKLVAAFLSREEELWHTVGLSYGTFYPAAGEVNDLRDRVREAVKLQQIGIVDPRERIAWHVRAASKRATRWHGLYGLKPASDTLHYYYDQKTGVRATEANLTDSQLDAIAEGFVRETSLDRTLPMILALFEGRPYEPLDRAAIAAVEGVLLREEIPWWIGETLERLLFRLGDPDPQARLKPLGEPYDEKDAQVVREVWAGAKRDLGLPEIPAALDSPIEVSRTGENTPS